MVKYATSTSPITHLIPPKILYNLCFSFLLGITTVPRETENNTYANFFWRWGVGEGEVRCIMGNVEVLKARRPWGRGWRICWFSVEKRQNGGWTTQNELRGHIHWFFLMKQTVHQYKKRLGSLQSLGLTDLCQTRAQSLFMCFGGERRLGVRLRSAREFFLLPFPWDPARAST